jgi:CheY-like chemotaxis protein
VEKAGWGHSTIEYALHVAQAAGAKRLALTHHDPLRDDDALDKLVARFQLNDPRDSSSLEIFAAAEGQVIELSEQHSRSAVEGNLSAKIAVVPALVGQSVLLAMSDTAKATDLAKVLRSDAVRVLTSDTAAALAVTERERPSLLVLENTGETAQVVEICRAVRQLGQYGRDLPIILETKSDIPRAGEELGINDHLVEPYSLSYARTRFRAWLMRTACRWVRAPKPEDEVGRLATLYRLALLDSPPEKRFDRLTQLAASALDAPIALITLIDRDRQWFKSTWGIETKETPRDESFCAHAVFDRVPLIVPDALLDPKFADNPQVVGPPHVRFYAGYPLVVSDGSCVGTLCVADIRPRELTPTALDPLRYLAEIAVREMERPQTSPAGQFPAQ